MKVVVGSEVPGHTDVPSWQREVGWLDRTVERIEDAPVNLLSRKSVVTISQRRKLWKTGIRGRATILGAPSEKWIDPNGETSARYHVRVEAPDAPPYEVKSFQAVTMGAWRRMPEGAEVDVVIDPKKPKRVLLIPPRQAPAD